LLRSTAALFCYFNAPFLLYACLAGDYVYGRLNANDIGPNIWGSFGLFLCVCAIGRKFNALTLSFFLIGLYTIYASSSRTSMTAIAAAGLVLLFCFIAEIRGWTIPTTLFAAIGTTLAVTIFFDPYVLDLVDFVTNGLLKLDSTDRGVGSGFTGRSTIWAETLQLWINSPLLGVGFRQHEALLPGGMSAHNAYLAMLADMGMAGLLLYVGLIASALFAAMSITDRANRRFILAIIASYIAYGFFERRAINSGNPYSLIFLFACFYALSDRSLRSARLIG
jgi:O-antigen ligase